MNANRIDGELNAAGARFGIVLSRFNAFIGERLLQGALAALARHGADPALIDIVHVPGAYEIPLAAKTLGASGRYDAVIALGAVIRGDTPHFEYVAGECARGLTQVALELGLPVAFGVLTVDNVKQAMERSGEPAEHPLLKDATDQAIAGGHKQDQRNYKQRQKHPKKAKSGNKGVDAALTAIEMVNLLKKLRG